MNRRRLFLEAPVGDYLPDNFKDMAKETSRQLYDDPRDPAPSSNEVGMLMMALPRMEYSKKRQLVDLALKAILDLRPEMKKLVENGKIKFDADLTTSPGGRMKSQAPDKSEIEKAKQKDPNFDEKIKKRNFTNARVQGRAWIDGFGSIKKLESQIKSIDPSLYDQYVKFTNGASRFYWENTEMLENMASHGAGRMAYCDVYPDKSNPGSWIIEARAPHFPLLMHELVKGVEYYKSLFSLPADKTVSDAITNTADTHRHEIQNMNYGRVLWSKVKFFLNEYVDGYEPSMESDISTMIENLPEQEYNKYMDGIVNNNNQSIKEFIEFCEECVEVLKQ
jgi:hypothetical protein